ncbi:fluoride efflux transporter FluC [Prochlorococcus marinus]|uniref:fluoride efflux transporter FluC n=1 Tax=Prochlorococcus marinus TaxID=1219 RepID=UPI0022B56D21|nr:CrcB family protein [Prochlorococcus marinus]
MDNLLKNNDFVFISIGAIPAALFRWQIDQIFFVNAIGCFLLGFINALPIRRRLKLIFGFGFCGSFTTFSGWSFQLFELINNSFYKLFFLNILLIVLIGFIAVCLGHFVAKKIIN